MGIPESNLPHTVTRVRPAASTDSYGNTVYDYGAGATRTEWAAWIEQADRSEPREDGRDADIALWLLITNESDLLSTDHIEWTGPTGAIEFSVDGSPEPVYAPAGFHHTEAALRVVAG